MTCACCVHSNDVILSAGADWHRDKCKTEYHSEEDRRHTDTGTPGDFQELTKQYMCVCT